jgi:hypothetical protein
MRIAMACLAVLLFAGPVAAQPQQSKKGKACKADVVKFCQGVEKGKVGDCIKQHADDLSDECRAALEKGKVYSKLRRYNCRADVEKFCKGQGDSGECLKRHKKELSDVCKASRKRVAEYAKEIRRY